jgi:hypothetical protein
MDAQAANEEAQREIGGCEPRDKFRPRGIDVRHVPGTFQPNSQSSGGPPCLPLGLSALRFDVPSR